jgi:hypothetical protein
MAKPTDPLADVKRATAKRARAEKARKDAQDVWAAAIREAHAAGATTRQIAAVSGVSFVFVAKLVREGANDGK